MANPQRGEVAAVLDGEERVLCLTLGALAELEARLGAGDLAGLGERVCRRAGFGAGPDGDHRRGAARGWQRGERR